MKLVGLLAVVGGAGVGGVAYMVPGMDPNQAIAMYLVAGVLGVVGLWFMIRKSAAE